MAKDKLRFVCQECGYETIKWLGQCPGCKQWNTFVEEVVSSEKTKQQVTFLSNPPRSIQEIRPEQYQRLKTQDRKSVV